MKAIWLKLKTKYFLKIILTGILLNFYTKDYNQKRSLEISFFPCWFWPKTMAPVNKAK